MTSAAETVIDFLRGRASGADQHTAQVYLLDRKAQLAYRSADMPPARFVADLMTQLSRIP
jgi:hypothetical protein